MALYGHLFWSLPYGFLRKKKGKGKKKKMKIVSFCSFWAFCSPLILVDQDFIIIKYQSILDVWKKKKEKKKKNQVMLPLSKGLTLCMLLESQLSDCRVVDLAVLPQS